MSRKLIRILFLFLSMATLCLVPCLTQAETPAAPPAPESLAVLPPSVAGAFYPADAETLRADINRYLEAVKLPEIEGEIVAAIVPHAGYKYSGPIAAYAYKAIGDQEESKANAGSGHGLDAVVVLAFSHRKPYRNVSVYPSGSMETPLGRAVVNAAAAKTFMDSRPRLTFERDLFLGEHSAETQIPFLQTVLPGIPVVPVIFGRQGMANIEAVAAGLDKLSEDNRILVVATSDLSHYNPYEMANTLDGETVGVILKGDPLEMARHAGEKRGAMCGPGPVIAALSFAQSQGARPMLLKYANSGDTAGTKDAVVGYVAIVFVKDAKPGKDASAPKPKAPADESDEEYLTENDKKALLELARMSVESIVRDKKLIEVDKPDSKRLTESGAAFVTLRLNGRLRGCIGRMAATTPLYETVIRMAAAAATEDRRFSRVTPDELADIHIEISVNTPLRRVSGPDEIVLGEHGVVVSQGLRQGVFLPQVARETGWTKEEFLSALCARKAGLKPDAYKNGASLYVFTSIVFEEEE